MRIINDTNAVFDVEINPFLQIIKIKRVGISDTCLIRPYKGIEDNFSYESGRKYDFHFLYEDGLSFKIYAVNSNDETDYSKEIPYSLDIIIQ